MADVTIRMRPNGPLVIEGPFKLIDSRGAEFEIPANKPAVALCRCGQSSKRPFCDGSHKTCGFVSDEAPTPPAVDEPSGRHSCLLRCVRMPYAFDFTKHTALTDTALSECNPHIRPAPAAKIPPQTESAR